ncbi:uncharacterized protein TNIN_346821 [Trichonephila inaurata madagascariensis]|uniref:Peptidase aspartic putative domain-containing protein n=1 Tax=Trichonephila inaurata madagascariensis TaxID=2747483 RepID=A0A8X6YF01_9ARAC|nr:uncharacterized protein TNIN_346821 [Trichonephila inaurata madagascariensis]
MKLANALAKEIPSDPAELKAKLDIIDQVHEKFELLKEEYHKTVQKEDFEEIVIILAEMDDEIQKIENGFSEKRNRLCYNCLGQYHNLSNCNSRSSCFVCKKSNHHILLHKYSDPTCFKRLEETATIQVQFADNRQPSHDSPVQENINSSVSFFINGNAKRVPINTAIVFVTDLRGEKRPLRAILDSASENNFITTDASKALGLKIQKISVPICGLNNSVLNVSKGVTVQLFNDNNDFQCGIDLLIVPKNTDATPTKKIDILHLKIPNNVKLANPNFLSHIRSIYFSEQSISLNS